MGETTASYGNPIIYLYLGGFVIGLAVEKWDLHKRIAFNIIGSVGTKPKNLLLGIMVATAFLSMWISNTATTIMMLPIGISIIEVFDGKRAFARNMLLGIAYSASIGGMATLIGTPPNLILAGVVKESLGIEISFLKWFLFAAPLAFILLMGVYWYLTRAISIPEKKGPHDGFHLARLGKMSTQEKRVSFVFILTAFLWITRSFLINPWLPAVDDTMIAIFGGILILSLPAKKGNGPRLLEWEEAKKLPWSVLILFGAGLAIAKGFSTTDLTNWLGHSFEELNFLPAALLMLIVLASINFLTEITSNVATASMLLPILITLGLTLEMEPLPLMAGAAIAASCAFMLPVATPPNAIVFSSGRITIPEMMKTGFLLNIFSVLVIFLFVTFFWDLIF